MPDKNELLDKVIPRIDEVLKGNQLVFWIQVFLAVVLFLLGIGALCFALMSNQLIWAVPPAFTTFFLRYPFEKIIEMRNKNIALATVPVLIRELPDEKAVEEIQKLIRQLYGTDHE